MALQPATIASVTALILSSIATFLSVVSLTWQFTQYKLNGPRVRVQAMMGAIGASHLVTYPVPRPAEWATKLSRLSEQGINVPLLAGKAVNVGRMGIRVFGFSVEFPSGLSVSPLGNSHENAPFPYELSAHSENTWVIELREVFAAADAGMHAIKGEDFTRVRMVIKLAGGREVRSGWLRLPLTG